MRIFINSILLLLVLVSASHAQWRTIANGHFWHDTAGKRIEAHGSGFIKVGDTFYWIGEDKSHNKHTFKAVNCYASTDLVNWQFRKSIVTRNTHPALNKSWRVIERPKIIYNETTKKYVMWLHWESSDYAEAEAGVFVSDTVDGDYTLVDHFRPNGNMSRDCALFKDDDGRAYFISAANDNADLAVYRLTPDYLAVEKQIDTLWPHSWREAPAIVKKDSVYFLITSGATGWEPNQAKYATAKSISGPWTSLRNLGDSKTFDTQPTFILPIEGMDGTTFIYCSDRWQDPDLQSSKYIWLPLSLSGTKASLRWRKSWQIDPAAGVWALNGRGDAPDAPTLLEFFFVGASSLQFTWQDNSDNEAAFEIERKIENGVFVKVDTVGVNGREFQDKGLPGNSSVTYRVRSFNGAGYSPNSNELTATTGQAQGSLILHYAFDAGVGNTAFDSSGHALHGLLINGPTWVDGKSGSALHFDGQNDYVDAGDSPEFDITSEITITAWVRQEDAGNSQHNPWVTKGDHAFGLKHANDNNFQFFIYDDTWYSANYPAKASFNNAWHFFAGTYDGAKLCLYIDGDLAAVSHHVGTIYLDARHGVNIGHNSENSTRFFRGAIDDVRIYRTALNADQIKSLTNSENSRVACADEKTPAGGRLYQNYPNPFNPKTEIKFELPKNGYVHLDIYSVTGKKIKQLAQQKFPAGIHSVVWDGVNDNGSPSPSGFYFYQIISTTFTKSRSMLLLR